MKQEVKRNYLEIHSLQDLKESKLPSEDYSLELLDPINFQLNKFFYKNIGKKHNWVDRLIWSEQQWIDYILSKKVKTYVFKHCLLYTSPSPRDVEESRMPSSA